MNTTEPSDAPPAYEEATNQTRNGIPPQSRRSMEDEHRPLPPGWVRQFDADTHHQFFVDTTANPPRSTWSHPHDDEQYLNSLSADERHHINRVTRSVSLKDIEAESSDDEGHGHHHTAAAKRVPASSGASATDPNPKGIHKFGRKMKDRLTKSTHQEREKDRAVRAKEEQEMYKAHLAFRRAMSRALETGQPQFVGKDREGREIYIEPPQGLMQANGMMIPQGGRVPAGARGYNPYSQGPYGNPNARFLRPQQPYARGPGYGYGGGYGYPLMGGLLGGALLGGLLF